MAGDEKDGNGYTRRRADDFIEKYAKLEVAVDRLTEHERLDKPRYERWREDFLTLQKAIPIDLDIRLRLLEGRPVFNPTDLDNRVKELEKRPETSDPVDKRLKWLEHIAWMAVGGFAVFEFFTRILGKV